MIFLHLSLFCSGINVRPTSIEDIEKLEKLSSTLELSDDVMEHIDMYVKYRRNKASLNNKVQSFVAICANQIIGVAVIEQEKNINYLRSHYAIEDFMYFNHHSYEEHGHIWHLAVNPAFHAFTRLFMKEIMRLASKTCLYYPVYPEKSISAKPAHSVIGCLSEMVPVQTRRQPEYVPEKLDINNPSQAVTRQQLPFALFHTNIKLCLEEKHGVNAKVVVVGASDTGLALLERLVMSPHINFHNVTLLSTHGLPQIPVSLNEETGKIEEHFCNSFKVKQNVCDGLDHHRMLYLKCAVNSVEGRMTAINRTQKYLVVNGQRHLPYDFLVLTTGQQYELPRLISGRPSTKLSEVKRRDETPPLSASERTRSVVSMEPTTMTFNSQILRPNSIFLNCFTLNDFRDALEFFNWLAEMYDFDTNGDETTVADQEQTDDGSVTLNGPKIVVYGRTFDAYCSISALLQNGVKPRDLVFVLPPLQDEDPTCFNNPAAEIVFHSKLDDLQVLVLNEASIQDWKCEGDNVASLTFQQNETGQRFEISDLLAFISYENKSISFETYRALNNACLVIDGKLVIDTDFHTNDPVIRAAGPLTKYSRKLYADRATHDLFNAREVGMDMGRRLLVHFDPIQGPPPARPKNMEPMVPLFDHPRIFEAAFECFGFHYLQVEKPGPRHRLDDLQRAYDYGEEMVTGQPDTFNYFRIHLNMNETVQTITCISKLEKHLSQYVALYGVHERYLNGLKARWGESLITDFYDYFSEPWAHAVFHDRMRDLRDEIRQIFADDSDEAAGKGQEGFEAKLRDYIGSDIQMTRFLRDFIKDNYNSAECAELKKSIEKRLISFLDYNGNHLPMYAKPGMI